MIVTTLLAGIEQAVNRLLLLDPEVAQALFEMHGKVLQFHFSDFGFDAFVQVRPDRLLLTAHYDGPVDVKLSGSSLTFLRTYTQGFVVGAGPQIEGNLELAESFQEQMQRFDIDWEELLSVVLGDIAAHKVHSTVKDVLAWGADSLSRLRMDASEYVHEEARIAPSRAELENFIDEISLVRDGVERAQARVDRLLKSMEA